MYFLEKVNQYKIPPSKYMRKLMGSATDQDSIRGAIISQAKPAIEHKKRIGFSRMTRKPKRLNATFEKANSANGATMSRKWQERNIASQPFRAVSLIANLVIT